jgi:hypothetical protein
MAMLSRNMQNISAAHFFIGDLPCGSFNPRIECAIAE